MASADAPDANEDETLTRKLNDLFAAVHASPQSAGERPSTPPVSVGRVAPSPRPAAERPPIPPPPAANAAPAPPRSRPPSPSTDVPLAAGLDELRSVLVAQMEAVHHAVRQLDARLSALEDLKALPVQVAGLEELVRERLTADQGLQDVAMELREEIFDWLTSYTAWENEQLGDLRARLGELRAAFVPAAPPETHGSAGHRRFSAG